MNVALLILLVAAQLAVSAPPPVTPVAAEQVVEIVVYSDFQCPFCGAFAAPLREVQKHGVDGVKTSVRFKHYPLVIHPKALLAHQAAAAAAAQGKFWEMHDALFANRQNAQREDLIGYAKKIGLDMKRFLKDLDSDRVKALIRADQADGEKLRISGTPTFYVNGKEYVGTKSLAQLRPILVGEQRRARVLAEIAEGRLSLGPANAPIALEFFADLQSPVSRPAAAVLKEILGRYPEDVRVQFRNFPLAFHPQAALAHEAAMTAARDGKFWDFAFYVLEHQESLHEQDLIALAGKLGLDETAFAEALHQHRYAARVDADLQAGRARGIRGSPVILVNDKRIDGVPSLDTLITYIEEELAARRANQPVKP
ncbi:MAG: DsbA family protein [Vicinamibacterales bacterium]